MKVTICFASGVRHQVQIGTNLPCLKLLQESQDSDTSLEHLFGSDVATEGDCDIDADVLDGTTYFGSPVHTERRTAEVVRNQYTAPHDMPLIAHPWLFDKVIGLNLIDCCRHLADDGWGRLRYIVERLPEYRRQGLYRRSFSFYPDPGS